MVSDLVLGKILEVSYYLLTALDLIQSKKIRIFMVSDLVLGSQSCRDLLTALNLIQGIKIRILEVSDLV